MGGHHNEKNVENPLGMKGKLAKRFGEVIQALWNGNESSFSCSRLKNTLGKRKRVYERFDQ